MATDCKSVDGSLPWFKSMFHHHKADLAQPAEHIHGKDGVFGSNPKIGSSLRISASEFTQYFGAIILS